MPETPDEVRAIAERGGRAPATRALKLGWGPLGEDLDRDVELVAAARDALGPERKLMVDGGMAYTVKSALELVRRVEELGIYWLEEPLAADDYEGYRRLSDAASVRIAAGEADSGHPALPRAGRARPRRRAPTRSRALRRLHRRPRDRRSGARDGVEVGPALLLDRRARRGVAALRRRARPRPTLVRVLGRQLAARQRPTRRAVRARGREARTSPPAPGSESRSTRSCSSGCATPADSGRRPARSLDGAGDDAADQMTLEDRGRRRSPAAR